MKTQPERIAELAHELVAHRLKTEPMFGDQQCAMALREKWSPDRIAQEVNNTIATHVAEEVANARFAIMALDAALADPVSRAGSVFLKRSKE